jgi:glycosyltransferase 2 family protein
LTTRSGSGSLPGNGSRLRLVGIVVSVVSLAGVALWASEQDAPTLPTSATAVAALLAAVGAYAVATAIRSERWHGLLRHSGARPLRRDSYGLMPVGYMGNNVLPARGGDMMRVYFMAPRAGTGMRTVIGTLVAERVLDVAVLLGLFGVVAYGVRGGDGAPGGRVAWVAAALVLAGLALLALMLFARRNGRAERAREFLRPMLATTRTLRGRVGLEMLAGTIVLWAVEAGTWYGTAAAAGLDASVVDVLYLLALASVFVMVPAGPGNLGTLDAAVVFGVHSIGGTGAEALSYLLLLRFVLFVPITVAGLGVLLARYGGLRRVGVARAEAASA